MTEFSEAKYDKWSGYDSNLFSNSEYDEEDREADVQYVHVEKYIEGRRKSRTEKKFKETISKLREERPTIKQQFSDLKTGLVKVSKDEWENIPDIPDYTIKKKKQERYTPISDKIIEQGLQDNMTLNSINPSDLNLQEKSILDNSTNGINSISNSNLDNSNNLYDSFYSGFESVADTKSNLNEFGKAKNSVLSYVFNKMSNSVSGQTSVNPAGYITDLNSLKVNSSTDIADVKKARLLMRSIINTNSKNVAGWIGAARIEEMDGKLSQAREIISQAAENILDSEDIWLEAARLHVKIYLII
jgi:pre-mRNA-processing factor 6